jgi:hypothetical protein
MVPVMPESLGSVCNAPVKFVIQQNLSTLDMDYGQGHSCEKEGKEKCQHKYTRTNSLHQLGNGEGRAWWRERSVFYTELELRGSLKPWGSACRSWKNKRAQIEKRQKGTLKLASSENVNTLAMITWESNFCFPPP